MKRLYISHLFMLILGYWMLRIVFDGECGFGGLGLIGAMAKNAHDTCALVAILCMGLIAVPLFGLSVYGDLNKKNIGYKRGLFDYRALIASAIISSFFVAILFLDFSSDTVTFNKGYLIYLIIFSSFDEIKIALLASVYSVLGVILGLFFYLLKLNIMKLKNRLE